MTAPDPTSTRSVQHDTFVVERTIDAPIGRVYHAWADPAAKARWFIGPDEQATTDHELDFRVGGREHVSGSFPGGSYAVDASYYDIVPQQRIVYAYEMHIDGRRISVSLATIELRPVGSGTHLMITEQGAFLDGLDVPADRARGTNEILDNLEASLRAESKSEATQARPS
jgi:uncharacterized protein YndB with AHSA1/START domain